MRVQLKRPVKFLGVTYKQGVCEIPKKACSGWFFEALVESGIALILQNFAQNKEPKETKAVDVKAVETKAADVKAADVKAAQDAIKIVKPS